MMDVKNNGIKAQKIPSLGLMISSTQEGDFVIYL